MKKISLKRTLIIACLGIMAIGTTAFAGGYGGYALPVKQGNNY